MAGNTSLWPFGLDAAIFDFDGTLASTEDIWHEVDRLFLEKRGIPYVEDLDAALAPLSFEGCAIYVKERFGLTDSIENICREWNEIAEDLYTATVHLRPGAEAYIRALRAAGVPCALATTNDPQVLAVSNRHTHVLELFDAHVYGTDVTVPKTEPDIYLEAARRLGIAPERCMVFEDVIEGIRSARDAGMATCAVAANQDAWMERVKRDEADVYLESWEDIEL